MIDENLVEQLEIELQRQEVWINLLLRYTGDLSDKLVFDNGCGLGALSFKISENGAYCYGLDISDSRLGVAQNRNNQHIGNRANFIKGDCHNLPIESNAFDVVVSIGVMEHVDNHQSFMLEMIRILKPGGIFYLVCGPNKRIPFDSKYHKIQVVKYPDPKEMIKTISPHMAQVNRHWGDVVEYRLRNQKATLSKYSLFHVSVYFAISIFNKMKLVSVGAGLAKLADKCLLSHNIVIIATKHNISLK